MILLLCGPPTDGHPEEVGHVLQLPVRVGVEERLEALTAAPEDEILGAELVSHFEPLPDGRTGAGEHVRVRVGGGAVHVPGAWVPV